MSSSATRVFPWRTVEAEYRLWPGDRGPAQGGARRRASPEPSTIAGLTGFAKSFPRMLSGGMRQRVALMRTLIMEPEILLMDEPFGALDTHTKLEMHKTLLEIWERERQTVLFVTHDLGEALTLASRIILLSARPGRLKEDFDVALPAAARPGRLARDAGIRPALLAHLAFPRRRVSAHQGRMIMTPHALAILFWQMPSWRRCSSSGSGALSGARRCCRRPMCRTSSTRISYRQAVRDLAELPEARLLSGRRTALAPASTPTPTISGSLRW